MRIDGVSLSRAKKHRCLLVPRLLIFGMLTQWRHLHVRPQASRLFWVGFATSVQLQLLMTRSQ